MSPGLISTRNPFRWDLSVKLSGLDGVVRDISMNSSWVSRFFPPRRTGLAPYPIVFTCSEKFSEPMVSSYRMQFSEKVFLEVQRDMEDSTRINIPNYTAKVRFSILLPTELLSELAPTRRVHSRFTR